MQENDEKQNRGLSPARLGPQMTRSSYNSPKPQKYSNQKSRRFLLAMMVVEDGWIGARRQVSHYLQKCKVATVHPSQAVLVGVTTDVNGTSASLEILAGIRLLSLYNEQHSKKESVLLLWFCVMVRWEGTVPN
jgi:hypothetical protein